MVPPLFQLPSIFNNPLPRRPPMADNRVSSDIAHSKIPLANYSDINLQDEADFVPGVIVPNNAFLNPLMKFRDSLVTRLIPALQRPFNRQADPAVTYYDDCTDKSGFYCKDCSTIMASNQLVKKQNQYSPGNYTYSCVIKALIP